MQSTKFNLIFKFLFSHSKFNDSLSSYQNFKISVTFNSSLNRFIGIKFYFLWQNFLQTGHFYWLFILHKFKPNALGNFQPFYFILILPNCFLSILILYWENNLYCGEKIMFGDYFISYDKYNYQSTYQKKLFSSWFN